MSDTAQVHDNKYQFLLDSSYGFNGVHEVSFVSASGANEEWFSHESITINPTSSLRSVSRDMMLAGYMVSEVEILHTKLNKETSEVVVQKRYLVVLVCVDNTWYVVEDVVVG